jgi:hypothetical protein
MDPATDNPDFRPRRRWLRRRSNRSRCLLLRVVSFPHHKQTPFQAARKASRFLVSSPSIHKATSVLVNSANVFAKSQSGRRCPVKIKETKPCEIPAFCAISIWFILAPLLKFRFAPPTAARHGVRVFSDRYGLRLCQRSTTRSQILNCAWVVQLKSFKVIKYWNP